MKKYFISLIFALTILSLPFNVFGQKVQRIKFKKGATSAIVTGSLKNYKDKLRYVIDLRAGQSLEIEQIGKAGNHYVSVYFTALKGEDDGGLDASCHSNYRLEKTVAGDHKFEVVECQKADKWKGTFKLKITVK